MNQNKKEKQSKNHKMALIISCTVVLCLTLAYTGLCISANATDRIFPRTSVAGVSVGGMTLEEAAQRLKEESLSADQGILFEVRDENKTVPIRIPSSCVEIDAETSAARALSVGQDAVLFKKGFLYLSGKNVEPSYLATEDLDMILDDMDQKIGESVQESRYTVTDTELELVKGTPGRLANRDNVKEQVLSLLGKGETVSGTETTPQFTVTLEETLPAPLDLQAVYDDVHVAMQNASVNAANNEMQMDVTGISFDVEAAKTAFESLAAGANCKIPLVITKPEVTIQQLEGVLYRDLLGAATSNIGGSSNRLSNVKRAAIACDGQVLMPGETFSYNGIVGRRTSERGYLPAPAYVAGATVSEVGGGICQVSSTLYLATLRSNLEIVERYNHGYTVKYVPDGMDATVYYGSKDYQFKNNSKFPIKIAANVSDRTLSVSIYGTKTDHLTVKMEGVQLSQSSFKTVYEVNQSLSAGKTIVSVTPYSGCKVEVYRCIYADGNLVSRNRESVNVYKSRDKVIQVSPVDAGKYGLSGGTKPAEPSKPKEPVKPTKPTKPAEPVKPVKPAEPTQPVEPVKPPEQSIEPTPPPVTPEQPTEPVPPTPDVATTPAT
ncbi:MAG: VanW family protein [Evtepia sp.]